MQLDNCFKQAIGKLNVFANLLSILGEKYVKDKFSFEYFRSRCSLNFKTSTLKIL